MKYVEIDSDGIVTSVSQTFEKVTVVPEGLIEFPLEVPLKECTNYRYVGGEFIKIPEKPSHYHKFDSGSGTWVEDLNSLKNNKRKELTQKNFTKQETPVNHDGILIDGNMPSQYAIRSKLDEIELCKKLNVAMEASELYWKDATNQKHTWDTVEEYQSWLESIYAKVLRKNAKLFSELTAAKDAVEVAESVEQIKSVNLPDV